MRKYTFVIHLINGDMRNYQCTAKNDLRAYTWLCSQESVQELSHDEVRHTEIFSIAIEK